MGQFRKFGVFIALGGFLAASAPAMAGAHVCVSAARPHHGRHIHTRLSNVAYGTPVGVTPAAPYPDETPGPYPVGYDGSSWSPTGDGVVYNVPPAAYLPPRIIYVNEDYFRRHPFPRQRGIIILRGNEVSAVN